MARLPDDAQGHSKDDEAADHVRGEIVEDGERVDGGVMDDTPARRRVFEATSFSGPLPPPDAMTAYNEVVPGLAREIADQWKAETAHRHKTIDDLRATDREAMRLFHEGERRGQRYAFAAIVLLLGVVLVSLILDRRVVGVASVIVGGAAVVWALRRRSDIPDSPTTKSVDLADGDQLEGTA
jgi:uncharacterized membrane protein